MTFPQWYFRNVIEKDRKRQNFSSMLTSRKWEIINRKIQDLKKNNPRRYNELFSKYTESELAPPTEELPKNNSTQIGFKELYRLSEMSEQERRMESSWNEEIEGLISHFKNARLSALIKALIKVSG